MMPRRAYGTGSLLVVKDSAGREVYYGKWRADGRQVKRRIGPKRTASRADGLTVREAQKELAELMAKDAAALQVRSRRQTTIADLDAAYRADRGVKLKASTLSDYAGMARLHLVPHFGSTPVERIDRADVQAFVAKLHADGYAAKSVRHRVTYVATLLNYAVREQLIPDASAARVTLPEEVDRVDELRFLTVDQVNDLMQAAQPGVYQRLDRALYAVAALAGLRQGEARGLQWRSVDFASRRIRVEESVVRSRRTTPKSKRRRSVPMSRRVADELLALQAESQWTAPTDPVFAAPATGDPMARTRLMERYRKALEAARIPVDFRYHDLRHTFGTQLAKVGVPVTTIQAYLGHSDLQTTQIYMHYAPADDEADVIDRAFAGGDPRYQPGTDVPPTDVAEDVAAT